MTPGVGIVAIAIAAAAAAGVMTLYEMHVRALNARVSRVIRGVPDRARPVEDVTGFLAGVGARYRKFYSDENLEQLRALVQAAGYNPHRMLSVWVGVKVVSAVALPVAGLFLGRLSGKTPFDVLIYVLLGLVVGIMGPRLALFWMRRRFTAAVQRGTPDAIDLLVVCTEAGLGFEGALERVAQEMERSNAPTAQVLFNLLDDLRILPNRRDAFEKLGATSDSLRRFGSMISQSMQYGTPLGHALRAIAEEMRRDALIKLEERAHKLGAKLILPMVLFLLPAMFIILGGSSFLHLTRAFQ